MLPKVVARHLLVISLSVLLTAMATAPAGPSALTGFPTKRLPIPDAWVVKARNYLISSADAFGASHPTAVGATTASSPSVAYKLAAIDCRCVPSTQLVARYARVLTILSTKKCKESRRKLGDMSVAATRLLREAGRRVTTLRMLSLVNQSIPDRIGFKQPCIDIFVILVTSMSR